MKSWLYVFCWKSNPPMINSSCVNNKKSIIMNNVNWDEPSPNTAPYLSLLTMTASGPSDELKREHPSGQATPSGRTKAVRIGGVTLFGGSGHSFSSTLFSSSPFSNLSSSSANLMRFVLISEVGSSAGERSIEIFYKAENVKLTWLGLGLGG